MELSQLPLLLFAFLAGFVDSVVGGGGLIQLPALLIFLPQYPIASVFGTNKLVSITGTSIATIQYARKIKIPWKTVLITAGTAFCSSYLGARVVSLINPQLLRPFIIIMLIGIAIYIFIKKDFGSVQEAAEIPNKPFWWGIVIGGVLGFYDGFFGPGAGSFMIFAFIILLGFNFLTASGSSKVVNFSTNLAALLFFLFNGNVLFHIALPMIAFNMSGAFLGSRLALLRGNRFVRILFLVVVCGIISKLVWDTFGPMIHW
jgi:uncharacterized membrane protein YfcA